MSNVRPHVKVAVLSVFQRLRSASNAMQSSFSASFHSGESFKFPARLSPLSSSGAKARRLCQAGSNRSFHPSGCEAVEPGGFLRSQSVVGASRRSAAPGSQFLVAAEYGGGLSLRCYALAMKAKSAHSAFHTKAAYSCARPNPSMERTNNGGSNLSAFAYAQPPLFASHLKR